MKEVTSYEARIFIGLQEGYSGPTHDIDEVYDICQSYVDNIGLCVTVTPTRFIYKDGREPGAIVGLINYPRFPKLQIEIREKALRLAVRLRDTLKQHRVSVWFPDVTVMIGEQE